MAANFVFLAFGGFWWYPRLIGSCLNFFCACCCHFAAILSLFGGNLGPAGKLCSFNIVSSTYEGDGKSNETNGDWKDEPTYQDDANKMLILGCIQLVFWCA